MVKVLRARGGKGDGVQWRSVSCREASLKRLAKEYGILFGVAAVIIAIDQWTKYLVRTNIPFGMSWAPWSWLLPYARIVHWNNSGAAFGMLQNFGMVFTVLAIIVSILIIYYYPRLTAGDWVLRAALCLQLSGAVGNLIDRLTVGQVTDFISVGTFAVFNIADSCITVGVIILLIDFWVKDKQQKKTPVKSRSDETTIDPREGSGQGG